MCIRDRVEPCLFHGVDHLGSDEDVPLYGITVTCDSAGPVVAFVSGERRGPSLRVDETDLALLALVVSGDQRVEGLLRVAAGVQKCKSSQAVSQVGVRLRGDRTRSRFGRRNVGADGEELGSDRCLLYTSPGQGHARGEAVPGGLAPADRSEVENRQGDAGHLAGSSGRV